MTEQTSLPRLLVLASTYPRWAADHEPSFVHELARRLTSRFEVVVVCPHAKGARQSEMLDGVRVERYRYAPSRLETLVNDGGITTNLRRAPWKWLLVPSFVLMQWMVARRFVRPDTVVHAHWILTPGLVARVLAAPFVVTSHGADLFALRGKLPMRLKRWVTRRSHSLTVVSHAMLSEANGLLGDRTAQVSPMGVDLREVFVPSVATRREPGRMLFVGRLVEKKGVDVLLQALSRVLDVHPDARLTIIGFGPLEAMLQSECRNRGLDHVVTFAGALPSAALVDHYRSASVFVAPFRPAVSGDQEGLGLVLVEALGCGCPVVTSDIPAVRDVLEGMSGVFNVAVGDPVSLADGIIRALDAETSASVESTRSLLVDRFDWSAVADRYASVLMDARPV